MGDVKLTVLSEMQVGEAGILESLDLPANVQNHLMHMGFVPETRVVALHRAPAGDPTVYAVDGLEIALRKETTRHIHIRKAPECNDAEIPEQKTVSRKVRS